MQNTTTQILQLWDSVSNRRCTLRMDSLDASLPLGGLLDRYLKQAPIDRLLQESRITQPSADALYALQDLVYVSTDAGVLQSMFTGMSFREGEELIALDQIPSCPPYEEDTPTAVPGDDVALRGRRPPNRVVG